MAFHHSPKLNSNGLAFCIDAGNPKSYPGSGTAFYDLSGVGNTGTIAGTPSFTTDLYRSMTFDGSTNYVTFGNPASLQFASSITICAWYKQTNTGIRAIVSHGNNGFALYLDSGPRLWWAKPLVANDGGGPLVSLNTWYNVVLIWNYGSNVRYYLNGAFSQQNNFAATPSYGSEFRIGYSDSEGFAFVGNIAAVQIYKRVLTDQEIFTNFDTFRGRFGV